MLATEWSTKRWISQLRRSARGVMLLRTSSRSSECTLSRRDKNSSNWEICQCPTWPQGFPCTMGLKVFTGTYWQFHRRLLCWFKQTNKQTNKLLLRTDVSSGQSDFPITIPWVPQFSSMYLTGSVTVSRLSRKYVYTVKTFSVLAPPSWLATIWV